MAVVREYPKVKLFFGIMYRDKTVFDKVLKELQKLYGEFDTKSHEYVFSFTDYYKDEMGTSLKKVILSAKKLISREKLPAIKLKTNDIEQKFAKKGKRIINIDPGYLTDHNMILATAKELPHRIYIAKGILGDAQLKFKNGKFEPFQHTFADMKQKLVLDYFANLRKIYLSQK